MLVTDGAVPRVAFEHPPTNNTKITAPPRSSAVRTRDGRASTNEDGNAQVSSFAMARVDLRNDANVAGDWFVDTRCIDCGTCREIAPALFADHYDLSVVQHISNRVAVMYLGKIVELADRLDLYRDPRHPYTVSLLSAIPQPNPAKRRQRIVLKGDVPNPAHPPSGCNFHPRCFMAQEICSKEEPPLRRIAAGHHSACHFAEEVPAAAANLKLETGT